MVVCSDNQAADRAAGSGLAGKAQNIIQLIAAQQLYKSQWTSFPSPCRLVCVCVSVIPKLTSSHTSSKPHTPTHHKTTWMDRYHPMCCAAPVQSRTCSVHMSSRAGRLVTVTRSRLGLGRRCPLHTPRPPPARRCWAGLGLQ